MTFLLEAAVLGDGSPQPKMTCQSIDPYSFASCLRQAIIPQEGLCSIRGDSKEFTPGCWEVDWEESGSEGRGRGIRSGLLLREGNGDNAVIVIYCMSVDSARTVT